MKTNFHSILTVVNANANVERTLREDWEDDGCSQLHKGAIDQSQTFAPDPIARFYGGKCDDKLNATERFSWGILFSSEYFWAPEMGPMLIVCPSGFAKTDEITSPASNKSTINNCCILQFEDQLSTRNSLRIFHGY